jgi:hypothetical protein
MFQTLSFSVVCTYLLFQGGTSVGTVSNINHINDSNNSRVDITRPTPSVHEIPPKKIKKTIVDEYETSEARRLGTSLQRLVLLQQHKN